MRAILVIVIGAMCCLSLAENIDAEDVDKSAVIRKRKREGGLSNKKRGRIVADGFDNKEETEGEEHSLHRTKRKRAEGIDHSNSHEKSRKPPLYERRLAEAEGSVATYPQGTLSELVPLSTHEQHRPSQNAVFGVLFSRTMMGSDLKSFCATARKHFQGDIVIAIHPGLREKLMDMFKEYKVVLYEIRLSCFDRNGKINDDSDHCRFTDIPSMDPMPMAQIRYYIYWQWAKKYNSESRIMISDTRDVLFQSNPFDYHKEEWEGSHLAVFLEFHPNKVINRCIYNSGWVSSCYGADALALIGHNTVSCSGVTLGTRNGILIYSMLVARSIDPEFRVRGSNIAKISSNNLCHSKGMDQGIHNWLLYSGILNRIFDNKISIFEQGEGAVNTLGGLFGRDKLVKLNLTEAGIFKYNNDKKITIHNWNGSPSPVVHQFDRFSDLYFKGSFGHGVLEAFRGILD